MKKIYTLIALTTISFGMNAQNLVSHLGKNTVVDRSQSIISTVANAPEQLQLNASISKSVASQGSATAFYYEDFATGTDTTLVSGWKTWTRKYDGSIKSDSWKWTDKGSSVKNSLPKMDTSSYSSPNNGYMIIDAISKVYNGTTPDTSNIGMKSVAYLASPKINCTGHNTVKLWFNQLFANYYRDSTFVLISNDSAKWYRAKIDYNESIGETTLGENPNRVGIDVSSLAANKSLYLRFTFNSGPYFSGYGFAIDDVMLAELDSNDLGFYNLYAMSNYSNVKNMLTPLTHADSISFSAIIANNGSQLQQNAKLKVEVNQIISAGQIGPVLFGSESDTIHLPANGASYFELKNKFKPSKKGSYLISNEVTNGSVKDSNPLDNSFTSSFSINDSTFQAATFGYNRFKEFYLSTNTGNSLSYGSVFELKTNDTLTSVFFGTNNPANANKTFTFTLFRFDTSAYDESTPYLFNIDAPIASVDRVLKSTDITDFSQTSTVKQIKTQFISNKKYLVLDAGSYLMTVSEQSGTTGSTLLLSDDVPSASKAGYYLNGEFINSGRAPYLGINFGKPNKKIGVEFTNINETRTSNLLVFPNPTTGDLNIKLDNNSNSVAKIVNLNGQVVYTENVSNKTSVKIDMSNFSKGIYMLQVVSDKGISTNKIIKE